MARPSRRSLAASLAALLLPAPLLAQSWELGLRRVVIDHDPPAHVSTDREQFPAGMGVAGRRLWERGFFVGIDLSRGVENAPGAICGGFVHDPATQCVPELVRYSGGLAAISGGWLGVLPLGHRLAVGLDLRGGLGTVWLGERGEETGRRFAEHPPVWLLGAALEGSWAMSERGAALVLSLGGDRLRPFARDLCADCRQVVRDPLPGWRAGLGVRWRRR